MLKGRAISSFLLDDFHSPESCRDVYGALPVSVGLVDVDGGHGEELLQALLVVLLNRAEDGGENKVVLLETGKNLY